jgi:hypothetical protein
MSNLKSFTRWSGLASMAGGLLVAIAIPLHPLRYGQAVIHSPYSAIHVLIALGLLLALLGLMGIYIAQVEPVGRLGLSGFLLAFVGHALTLGGLMTEGFLWPAVGFYDPASVHTFDLTAGVGQVISLLTFIFLGGVALFAVGYALFGLATMRAGVLPRWSGVLVALGAVLYSAGDFSLPALGAHSPLVTVIESSGAIPFGLGFIWLGHALWTGARGGVGSSDSLQGKVAEATR